LPEKTVTASMGISLVVIIVNQLLGLGQNPMVSPEWVEANVHNMILPFIEGVPIISGAVPYVQMVTPHMMAVIFSFFFVWLAGYFIITRIGGFWGYGVAIIVGLIFMMWFMGGLEPIRQMLPKIPSM